VLVCHCHAINDRVIRAEILAGAIDADEVAERCGAGSRCGGCLPAIEALVARTTRVPVAVAVAVAAR
jgi:bacterioferritin-associated ferredoxin